MAAKGGLERCALVPEGLDMGSSRELASHSTLRRAARLSRGRNARARGCPARQNGMDFPRRSIRRCSRRMSHEQVLRVPGDPRGDSGGGAATAGWLYTATDARTAFYLDAFGLVLPFFLVSLYVLKHQRLAPRLVAVPVIVIIPRPVRGVRLQPPERLHEHLRADLTSGRPCPGPARSTTAGGVSPASPS